MWTYQARLPTLLAFFLSSVALQAGAQPECITSEYIESLNKKVIDKRIAHIEGDNAKLFLALDPFWSAPQFTAVPYRNPARMEERQLAFKKLKNAHIDEVLIWAFKRPTGIGAAMPFSRGCAVYGYGEPDDLEKLVLMHEAQFLVSQQGLDSTPVRSRIKELLMVSIYAPYANEDMIDIVINNVRPLLNHGKPILDSK